MKRYFVTFRSVTYAQRGESVLKEAGISCILQRTPRWMEEQGCGYCLGLSLRDGPGAVAALRRQQIPFRKVYLRTERGDTQEVEL
jgi:hypothetical protein